MKSDIILEISNKFMKEAKMSPKMLEDLAAMEMYMSESYDGRTFIELLQNADDANSKRLVVENINNTIIVANDGRVFNEDDINSICRSGSSQKKRGTSIGYRGIGFKSTTAISSEIIIHSDDIFFTFSKKIFAENLGTTVNKVPTIRVPFLYDPVNLSEEVLKLINLYKEQGYTTFFIFKDSNIKKFTSEVKEINNGWILFLNNVENISLRLEDFSYQCDISRKKLNKKSKLVNFKKTKEKWLIIESDNNISLAFKYDNNIGIIPCKPDEAVFHCYLPTIDSTGFAFKVNGDFSTDPSRKHIIKDNLTQEIIQKISILFSDLIKNASKKDNSKTIPSLNLLMNHLSLNELSLLLEENILKNLMNTKWIKLETGEFIYPNQYNIFPKWIDNASSEILKDNISFLKSSKICSFLNTNINNIDQFLLKLGAKEYNKTVFINILEDKNNLELISEHIWINLLVNIIKPCILNNSTSIKDCLIVLKNGKYKKLSDCTKSDKLDKSLINQIKSIFLDEEIDALCSNFNISKELFKDKTNNNVLKNSIFDKFVTKTNITKWRTAEQNCIVLEESFGYKAEDISKQNIGYDVISKTKDGDTRYIEVKSLKKLGDSFCITNNEYTAAHQYKDNYYLCLIVQNEDNIECVYIQNPLKTLNFEKRARAWEWFCDTYSGEKIIFNI